MEEYEKKMAEKRAKDLLESNALRPTPPRDYRKEAEADVVKATSAIEAYMQGKEIEFAGGKTDVSEFPNNNATIAGVSEKFKSMPLVSLNLHGMQNGGAEGLALGRVEAVKMVMAGFGVDLSRLTVSEEDTSLPGGSGFKGVYFQPKPNELMIAEEIAKNAHKDAEANAKFAAEETAYNIVLKRQAIVHSFFCADGGTPVVMSQHTAPAAATDAACSTPAH